MLYSSLEMSRLFIVKEGAPTVTGMNKTIDARFLFVGLFAYLLLPSLLWLLGWLESFYAVPACLVLIVCACQVVCRQTPLPCVLSRKKLFALFGILLLSFALADFTGITAHVPQSSDYSVRNAMYETLVCCDWPLYTNDGSYLVYYLAFWLPSAFIVKLFGAYSFAWWILEGWVSLGVALMSCYIYLQYGKKGLFFLLSMLLVSDFTKMWTTFSHEVFSPLLFHTLGKDAATSVCRYFSCLYFYQPSPLSNFCNSYHLILPTWGVLALLFTKGVPRGSRLFIAALLIPCSPLSGIAALLYFLVEALQDGFKTTFKTYFNAYTASAFLILIPIGVYLKCNLAGAVRFTPCCIDYKYWITYFISVVYILLPGCYIVRHCYKDVKFQACALILLVLPFIWIGAEHANELVFKGACVMWWLFAWMVVQTPKPLSRKVCFGVMLVVMAVPTVAYVAEKVKHYSFYTQESYVSNVLNGHFNHPETAPYCFQFKGKQPPKYLFLQHPGESSKGVLRMVSTSIRSDKYQGGGLRKTR